MLWPGVAPPLSPVLARIFRHRRGVAIHPLSLCLPDSAVLLCPLFGIPLPCPGSSRHRRVASWPVVARGIVVWSRHGHTPSRSAVGLAVRLGIYGATELEPACNSRRRYQHDRGTCFIGWIYARAVARGRRCAGLCPSRGRLATGTHVALAATRR